MRFLTSPLKLVFLLFMQIMKIDLFAPQVHVKASICISNFHGRVEPLSDKVTRIFFQTSIPVGQTQVVINTEYVR